MNDIRGPEEKLERITEFFFTGKKQQTFWFWAVGIGIVIPVLTLAGSFLVALLVSVVLGLLGLSSERHSDTITFLIVAICGLASLVGYYKLWVVYIRSTPKGT